MSLRDHEFEMILDWAGVPRRRFFLYTDDNEEIPSVAFLTIDQARAMVQYAYDMGHTDATQPTT